MKKTWIQNAAVTAAVFILITAMVLFNRKDYLGMKAYANQNLDASRITDMVARKGSFLASLVQSMSQKSSEPICLLSDRERLTQMITDAWTPVYEQILAYSYAVYPEKIKWAYEHSYSAGVSAQLASYKASYEKNGEPVLDSQKGVNYGPSGKETYYNFDMTIILDYLKSQGIRGRYYVREDGVKMYGDYIMVAADYAVHPYGSIVETSLGLGIVCDTGSFIYNNSYQLDIACDW